MKRGRGSFVDDEKETGVFSWIAGESKGDGGLFGPQAVRAGDDPGEHTILLAKAPN